MKSIYILSLSFLLIILSTPSTLLAQTDHHDDYLVLVNGDTLYGQIQYIDEHGTIREFYERIRLTSEDGKIRKYKRNGVSAFRIGNYTYESHRLKQISEQFTIGNPRYHIDPRSGEHHFLKVISKGMLSHYELEWFEQGNATLWSMALLKKEHDTYFVRADQGLLGLKRKALAAYFYDCPILVEAIQEKRLSEVQQVVDYYNGNCLP